MRVVRLLVASFASTLLPALSSWAAADPQQAAAAGAGRTGTWSCSLSHVSVSGICPPTPRQSGVCEIRKSAVGLTLVYVSGIRCSPKAACTFSCTERAGTLTCQNSGGADDEGGRYASTLAFTLAADKPISGTGKSSYAGPMGMRCEWKTSLTLTKPATRPEGR